MRLAVSNIAWPAGADAAAATLLTRHGVQGVEIAPTKVWPKPLEARSEEIRAYRCWWEDRGLPIVAFQALLFGRPELTIFADSSARRQTLDYLTGIFALAGQLGATALVFGSPKNRKIGNLQPVEVDKIAVSFFSEAAALAERHHVVFCLEPNPTEYSCDFVTCGAQAVSLAALVNRSGFGVHLDAGAMTLSRDPIEETFVSAAPYWKHFHVSEPFLRPIGTGGVAHAQFATALGDSGYRGWISIEMTEPHEEPWQGVLERALTTTRREYESCLSNCQTRSLRTSA